MISLHCYHQTIRTLAVDKILCLKNVGTHGSQRFSPQVDHLCQNLKNTYCEL